MDNKVLGQSHPLLVQETEISQLEELDFFLLKIDFQLTYTKHCIGIGAWVSAVTMYRILMRKNFDPLWSKLS